MLIKRLLERPGNPESWMFLRLLPKLPTIPVIKSPAFSSVEFPKLAYILPPSPLGLLYNDMCAFTYAPLAASHAATVKDLTNSLGNLMGWQDGVFCSLEYRSVTVLLYGLKLHVVHNLLVMLFCSCKRTIVCSRRQPPSLNCCL